MKAKTKAVLSEISIILLCIAMLAVFIGMLRYEYGKKETVSYVVTESEKVGRNYLITIRGSKGDEWQYWDSEWKPNGYIVKPVWDGDEIIDVEN